LPFAQQDIWEDYATGKAQWVAGCRLELGYAYCAFRRTQEQLGWWRKCSIPERGPGNLGIYDKKTETRSEK